MLTAMNGLYKQLGEKVKKARTKAGIEKLSRFNLDNFYRANNN